MDLKMIYLA